MSESDVIKKWGGIDTICPKCDKSTAVYPWNVKGGNGATCCVHCDVGLQVDKGNVIIAEYGDIEMTTFQISQQETAFTIGYASIEYPVKQDTRFSSALLGSLIVIAVVLIYAIAKIMLDSEKDS